jgi:predicted nucleic acid-binding protein
LLKFYVREPGSSAVLELFENNDVATSALARIEVVSAMHRKWREGLISEKYFRLVARQFALDARSAVWTWLPVTAGLLDAVQVAFERLPKGRFLRAADALHLASARDHGFKTIYSNDKHLLAAAGDFGLKAVNVIGS